MQIEKIHSSTDQSSLWLRSRFFKGVLDCYRQIFAAHLLIYATLNAAYFALDFDIPPFFRPLFFS